MISIATPVLQFVFIFIFWLHVLKNMAGFRELKRIFFSSVNRILLQEKNIYTRREIVMMETTISNFHTSVYIPEIQKLAFHISHLQILGTSNCVDYIWTAIKRCESFQDMICRRDYAERGVAIFDHQIQSEYDGENISLSIGGIK